MWGRICRAAAPSPAMPILRRFGTRFAAVRYVRGACAVRAGAEQPDPFVDHVEMDDLVLGRIADHPHRLAALLHGLDLLPQHPPTHHDAPVGGAQVVLRAGGGGALRFPRQGILPPHDIHLVLSLRAPWRAALT